MTNNELILPHRPAAARAPVRRGSALIAVIIALIAVQLVVIGVVALGSGDQSLAGLRLEASKAQYAAESGMNMALHEIYTGTDEDGDGGVGSISNDGNSANNPKVNGASIVVTMAASGGVTTLVSTAILPNAKRSITVTLQ